MGEVEKAMFEGLACNFELIFGLLTIQKCNLGEVEKGMFHGLVWHFLPIFELWTSTGFGRGQESDASWPRMSFSTYFRLLEQKKIDFYVVE